MAKKNVKTQEPKVQQTEELIEEVKTTSKKNTTAKKETVKKVKEVVKEEEEVLEEEADDTVEVEDGGVTGEKKKRVAPTRDSVLESFDDIIQSIEKEIELLRDSATKTKGIKFLRTLGKKLKTLKGQSTRIISKRAPSQRKPGSNTTSGFLKPVPVSKDIAKFAGWGVSEKKSRVEVTKFLCNYIRENKLQNDKDKRQIKPDSKLAKLLNYDEKTSSEPLTYFRLQSLLKHHFPKQEVTA